MDSGKDFFFGTKFSFFGGQGDLFSEASSLFQKFGAISRNSVQTLISNALLYGMFRDQ